MGCILKPNRPISLPRPTNTYRELFRSVSKKMLTLRDLTVLGTALTALLLCGCMHTALEPESMDTEVLRLAALNERELVYEVHDETPVGLEGHQYLFVLIPFGGVEVDAPARYVENLLYMKLAMRGYKPIPKASSRKLPARTLVVAIRSIQVSGYDFLVTRRIVCKVLLRGSIVDRNGRELRYWEGSGTSTAFKRFAFEPQLRRQFNEAIEKGLNELFSNLLGAT